MGLLVILYLSMGMLLGCALLETNKETGSPEEVTSVTNKLHGTYTGTIWIETTRTLTFSENNTLITYNREEGKRIFKYLLVSNPLAPRETIKPPESATHLVVCDVATEEIFSMRFRYVVEYDCFTLGEGIFATGDTITYYK